MMYEDPGWIDEFYSAISQYILVRRADQVLILPPNRVYKLNDSAFRILEFLKAGGKISNLKGLDSKRLGDIITFFRT